MRGLWVVLLCLALGVAVIAAVGTLRSAIERGLADNARSLLGGDLAIDTGYQAPPDALLTWLHAHGARTSQVVRMRSMLVAPSGERQLIELKAVDAAWPLVGQPETVPAEPLATALGNHDGIYGLLAERIVLDRLRLHPGDTVKLGVSTFRVTGVLVSEPDQVATPSVLGPRVLVSAAALPETGLLAPGAMVQHAVRLTVPQPAEASRLAGQLRGAFPETGWRIRQPRDAAPGVTQFINQTGLFLTLVGLTALLVGGIGVANGVRAWLDARSRTIATLRCLGASARLVFAVCLIQVMALALAGITAGLLAGATLPLAALMLLKGTLPVPPVLGFYARPLLLAAAYGILTAGAFALWPLGRAGRIPGAALFRDALLPTRAAPSRPLAAATVLLGLALVTLTVATAADRWFALWFCAAALITLAAFRLGGAVLIRLTRALPSPRSASVRLGVNNLHRPGTPAPMLLVSVGLGLSTLAAVALIQGNIRKAVLEQIPNDAPSFFFVDIQGDQVARFDQIVRSEPHLESMQQLPSLRARIVAVNGVPAEQVNATPDTRWALRGDRGLTYAATPPADTHLVAGTWWPRDYDGPPLVSFDANLAKGWHVGVGDTIRVNVLGRDIDLRIANLRDIAWRTLALNFAMVASPGLLAHAPHGYIATVRLPDAQQGTLLRRVSDALPNVTGIRVADILGAVMALLNQVAAALAATGSLTLLAGALVLAAAVAAGQRRRVQEAVVLKTLGATRAQIRAAWMVEFGVLGLTAGLLAALAGTAASYALMHYILRAEWVFLPGTLAVALITALAMMLAFGYVGTAAALRAKPAALLRNE